VEILGDARSGSRSDEQQPPASFEVDLDGGDAPGATPDDAGRGRWATAAGALGSADALGLAGIGVSAVNLTGTGLQIGYLLSLDGTTGPSEQGQAMVFGAGMIVAAIVGGLLSVAGLFRLGSTPTAFARAATGAGTLLGVGFLVVGALLVWHAMGLTDAVPQ
jgi:hypothetical protein